MASRNWYRLKASFLFAIFLLTTPFCCLLTLTLWLSYNVLCALNICTKKPSPKLVPPGLRRTVLVTDSVQTKSLHVVRILGKAGHRIILVDSDRYKHTGARWSRYVTKTFYVPHHAGPTQEKYINEVVRIALEENIDWFVPISKLQNAIVNYTVELRLAQLRPNIKCLGFGDLELARMLNHKINFLAHCKDIGLSVPDFREISCLEDLRRLRETGLYNEKHYFLKATSIDDRVSVDRLNFTRIPGNLEDFNDYVKDYEGKIDSNSNYFVCEYIYGSEFTSNTVCSQGKVLSIETLPTCSFPTEYDNEPNQAAKEWTIQFCKKMKISGALCFDFMQDDVTGTVYCIECNPRLHTCITLHHGNPKLSTVFQAALEPESVQDGAVSFPVEPPSNSPRVYWLYLEFYKLFTLRQGLGGFLWTLLNGRDAIYDVDDPLPFLASNTSNALIQISRAIVSGARFKAYYPILGRMYR